MNIARGQLGRLRAGLSTLSFMLGVALPAAAAILPTVAAAQQPGLPHDRLLLSINSAGHTVLAAGAGGLLLRSTDDGAHFQPVPSFTRATLTRLARAADGTAFAVGFDGTILRSTDDGESWMKLAEDASHDNPYFGLAAGPDGRVLAVGGFGRAVLSTDAGAHFAPFTVPQNDDGLHLNDLIANGALWLLVGENALAMTSADSGATWQHVTMPVQGSLFGAIAAGDRRFVAFGLRGHVAVSTDAAANWQAVPTGLASELLGGCVLRDGGVLLVGSRGGAIRLDPALLHASHVEASGDGSFADCAQTETGRVLAVGDAGMTELNIDQPGAGTAP